MPYGFSDESRNVEGSNKFVKSLFLHTNDIAEVYFVSDGPKIYHDYFHSVRVTGSNSKEWWTHKVCTNFSKGKCEYCEEDNRASKRLFVWLYVVNSYHSTSPRKIKTELVNKNGKEFYMEELNEVRLWSPGFGRDNALWDYIWSLYRKYNNTLLDRKYEIQRSGDKFPTYQIFSGDRQEIPRNVLSLYETLPDLGDVALGRVTSLDDTKSDNSADGRSDVVLLDDVGNVSSLEKEKEPIKSSDVLPREKEHSALVKSNEESFEDNGDEGSDEEVSDLF